MKNKNICKFVTQSQTDALIIHNFVLESDTDVMKKTTSITSHRIFLVKEGKCVFEVNGTEYDASSGSIFFMFSGETFTVSPDADTKYMYISFSGNRAEALFLIC